MTKYQNKTLKNTTLVMEECFFENCVLDECDLFFSGGDVEWGNVKFEKCRWHFRGPALRTFQLLQNFGMLKQGQIVVPPAAGGSTVN